MKLVTILSVMLLTTITAQAAPTSFDVFLTNFNYEARADSYLN